VGRFEQFKSVETGNTAAASGQSDRSQLPFVTMFHNIASARWLDVAKTWTPHRQARGETRRFMASLRSHACSSAEDLRRRQQQSADVLKVIVTVFR
jgi:hypothetical protein